MNNFKISKDTNVFISIAQHPGNFGTTLFNTAFRELGIDAIYKACKVEPNNLEDAIKGIRALGIMGCGVTMPFKKQVIKYLDSLDDLASEIGAVNTIVNLNSHLKGYNTDCYGAISVLKEIPELSNKKIVMLGAGSVAQAISCALKHLKANLNNVTIVNRSREEAIELAEKWGFSLSVLPWEERNNIKADFLINATPVGMAPNSEETPIEKEAIDNFEIIMDVVVNPLETLFLKLSKEKNKQTIPGYKMSLGQALKQFEIYTGKEAPKELMEKSIKKI